MTGAEIMAVVGFFIAVSGAGWGVWWRIDNKLEAKHAAASAQAAAGGALAATARDELAAYKLHVAETYVTKAGLSEQTAQMMRAIDGIGDRIDGLNERLDRVIEAHHKPVRRTS